MSRVRTVLLLASLGWSGHADAADVSIGIRIEPPVSQEVKIVVTAKALDGRGDPKTVSLNVGRGEDRCEARFPAGSGWLVHAEAPGHWSPSLTTAATGRHEMVLYRTGIVTGRLLGGDEVVALRLEPGPETAPVPTPDRFPCSVSLERAVRCEVPSGVWNVSFRVRDHAPKYFFGLRVEPGGVAPVGDLGLQPGASFAGYVGMAEKGRLVDDARVALRRKSPPGSSLSAKVLPNGFFQIVGLEPGDYVTVASREGFVPDTREVKILADVEAFLEHPLVLARAGILELTLSPPVAPDGKPWIAEIREPAPAGPSRAVGQAPAPEGRLTWKRLRLGRPFLVWIKTSDGHRWSAEEEPVVADAPIIKRHMEVSGELTKGVVFLGDQPLQASLTFGVNSNVQIPMASGADGSFAGPLPRLGLWKVRVSSDDPMVSRTIEADVVRGSGGYGEVEIRLDDFSLHGELVDEKGDLFEELTFVNVALPGGVITTQKRIEGGRFRISGLSPGDYRVHGEHGQRVSDDVAVTLRSEKESDPVRLVMKTKKAVAVRVLGPSGDPLPGVSVLFFASEFNPSALYRTERTDEAGLAAIKDVRDSESERCVEVFGQLVGLSNRIARVPVGQGATRLELPPLGGDFEASVPDSVPEVWLVHAACSVGLRRLKRYQMPPNLRRPGLSFAALAPGAYSLCPTPTTQPGSDCRSGVLQPGGSLRLTLDKGAETTPR